MKDFIPHDSIEGEAPIQTGASNSAALSGVKKIAGFNHKHMLGPANVPDCGCGADLQQPAPCHCANNVMPAGTMSNEPIYMPSQEGYGAKRNWFALAVTAVLHIAAAFALLSASYVIVKKPPTKNIEVFSLTQPPPPEPAPPSPPQTLPLEVQHKPVAEIIIPNAIVKTPAIKTVTSVPKPEKVAAAAVATTLEKQDAPAPAPIIPPNFNAAQLNNPGPAYPFLSRRAREQGVVLLRVIVSVSGHAKSLSIERGSGYKRLDKAALATVKKWRFVPAKQAGIPVEAVVLVPVTFKLG